MLEVEVGDHEWAVVSGLRLLSTLRGGGVQHTPVGSDLQSEVEEYE